MLGAFRLLIGGTVAFFCATALFWAGIVFEHRPAGWPNIPLGVFRLRLPDGPWVRLQAIARVAAAAEAHNKAVAVQRAQVSEAIGLGEAKAQERIRVVYRTIRQEIPVAITPEIDRTFRLPVGLLRLHDAAARGVAVSAIPLAPGQTDDAASDVKASDLGRAIVSNYGDVCRPNEEQLGALEQWVRAQAAIK